MNICMQVLLYVSVATPQERQQFREYWRYQRVQWVKAHIIDDDPYDEETRRIREQQRGEMKDDGDSMP